MTMGDDQRDTLREADNYFRHGLCREALFLYRQLEAAGALAWDAEVNALVRHRIAELVDRLEDPIHRAGQPVESSHVVFQDSDGSHSLYPSGG